MIYPERLNLGDTIGVTATSAGLNNEIDVVKFKNAKKNLEEVGYHIVETDNIRKTKKLVSSSGEERTKEFYELWCDDNIKHIIALSGGEFLMEMLPWLDKYNLKDKKAKWVQGYSDTSLLLFYLTIKYNIATMHATNFGGYGRKEIEPLFMRPLEIISHGEGALQESFDMYESTPINWQEGKEFELPNLDTKVEYKNLYGDNKAQIEGRLLGGCMDVLKVIIGTSYDHVHEYCSQYEEGVIWYLENCEMSVCDVYRTLWQMREAGWFENAKGFIIGRTMKKDAVYDFTYEDALHNALDELKVPVIYDIDVGHTQLQWTMINGSFAKFEYEDGKGKIEMRFE